MRVRTVSRAGRAPAPRTTTVSLTALPRNDLARF